MADWKDLVVVLSMVLVLVGAGAMTVAAQMSVIVKGKVLEKGVATLKSEDGRSYPIHTISILLENDDRVFRIERGTVVTYAISNHDAQIIQVGSDVKLFISSYGKVGRLIELSGMNLV